MPTRTVTTCLARIVLVVGVTLPAAGETVGMPAAKRAAAPAHVGLAAGPPWIAHATRPPAAAQAVSLPLEAPADGLRAPPDGAASDPAAAELVERVGTKVVLIDVQVGRGGRAGTGFFTARGRVLTSDHVVRDADRITVWSNGTPYRARVAEHNPDLDLALLALPDTALLIKPLPLAPANSSLPGEPVLIIGSHPSPTAAHVRQSHVSGRFQGPAWFEWPAHHYVRSLELSAHVQLGDSGSPVLRLRDGAVIGVVRARDAPDADGNSPHAWAVPIDVAFPLLRSDAGVGRQATGPSPDDQFYLARP